MFTGYLRRPNNKNSGFFEFSDLYLGIEPDSKIFKIFV